MKSTFSSFRETARTSPDATTPEVTRCWHELVASGAASAASQLGFLERGRAPKVVIENLDEQDGVGTLTADLLLILALAGFFTVELQAFWG